MADTPYKDALLQQLVEDGFLDSPPRFVQRIAAGRYPYAVLVGANGDVFVSSWGTRDVHVFRERPEGLVADTRIAVERHPSTLLLSSNGERLFAVSASTDAISVIDTGPGVPDVVAETIFSAFEQAPGDSSRGGAGLGLFISRRLARMMGGDLTLEPARASGAHFRLTLTAARAGPITARNNLQDSITPDWEGLRILCVDDNDKNRRIAELLLGKLGLDVTLDRKSVV